MINFSQFRQYIQKTDQVKFNVDKNNPFFIVYLSENSTFLDDYSKLKLRRIDIRDILIPYTKIPLTRLQPEDRKIYRKFSIFPRSTTEKLPPGKNLIFDLSKFITSIEERWKPTTWRQRAGNLLKNMLVKSFSTVPENYQKILLYTVDISKYHNKFIDRKIFPILLQLRSGEFSFDHLLLGVISGSTCSYKLLVKNRQFDLSRVRSMISTLKFEDINETNEEDVKSATSKVMNHIDSSISNKNKDKVISVVKNYLMSKPDTTNQIIGNEEHPTFDSYKIATSALLTSINGDLNRSKSIAKNIPDSKKASALRAIDKHLIDEILPSKKTVSTTYEISTHLYDPVKAVDNKTPDHIFDKRQIDFKTNLQKDTLNSFNVLSNKDVPLKVDSIQMIEKKIKSTELSRSDINTIEAVLIDKDSIKHSIKIDVPKINKDGTFTINGRKKCLVNQIILIPLTFPKPYESRFESFYSTFRINSIRTKREQYLISYIGSYWIPLFPVLSFAFGFENTCKKYGVTYKITKEKPTKDIKFTTRIDKENYIIFENINSKLKEELCQSFIHTNISKYNITKEFGTREFFNELIVEYTGRINSTFRIQMNVENIVDPVSKQVLMNKQLPFTLEEIMYYMSSKVITGFKQDRNDLNNQRIRNSEVLIHLIQKQILASYTEYREQILSGNTKSKFDVPQGSVLNNFINNSQVVVDMEYANPVEEMSTLTRVSPVGKNVGGIPDERALQNEARNVHDSYFGNLDPLDTPEGGNVGITQHLTVDALITSSRGLFHQKPKTNNENSGILSTSTSLIPFVENDDGARVMFGANQGRQAVPLKNPEPPLVQSGYESLLTNVLSDNFIKKSPCDGKILQVTNDFISIQCGKTNKIDVPITPVHLRSGSGTNTLSVFKPIVKENQMVKLNQILAEGSCISEGSISLGRTLLTAIMPYKGYNFEDGIIISETLANSGKLTSLHGIQVEVQLSEKDRVLFINKIGKETIKGEPLFRKSIGEIEELIGFNEEETDQEVMSGQFIKKSPGGRIVDIQVFSNVSESKFPSLKELIKRTNKLYNRKEGEKFVDRNIPIDGVSIVFKIEKEMSIGVGDKLTNRHGAKGIISYIEKDENMPVTPWGEKVEIIVNPIGIISRMNLGQLYELYSGLIAKSIGIKLIQLKNKSRAIKLVEQVFELLDRSKNKEVSKRFISNFKQMSDRQYIQLLNQIQKRKGFSIVIPPFKSPTYREIIQVLKLLGLQSAYKLKLPEYNIQTIHEIPVGYMYFLKLEHIGREKIHSRSTGPVVSKTLQPTAGKSHEGGQRMGELDTYSFISYNALYTLSESFGPLSDDMKSKNEMISEVLQTGSTTFREPQSMPARDLLNFYFIALMLDRKQ